MLQEAADELHDFESEDSWALAVGFAIANEDRAVLDVDDARVGDGDFEDVQERDILESPRWKRPLGS